VIGRKGLVLVVALPAIPEDIAEHRIRFLGGDKPVGPSLIDRDTHLGSKLASLLPFRFRTGEKVLGFRQLLAGGPDSPELLRRRLRTLRCNRSEERLASTERLQLSHLGQRVRVVAHRPGSGVGFRLRPGLIGPAVDRSPCLVAAVDMIGLRLDASASVVTLGHSRFLLFTPSCWQICQNGEGDD
jgi:hypothetical protein